MLGLDAIVLVRLSMPLRMTNGLRDSGGTLAGCRKTVSVEGENKDEICRAVLGLAPNNSKGRVLNLCGGI